MHCDVRSQIIFRSCSPRNGTRRHKTKSFHGLHSVYSVKCTLAFKFFLLLSSGFFSGVNCFSRNYKLHRTSSTRNWGQTWTWRRSGLLAPCPSLSLFAWTEYAGRSHPGSRLVGLQSWSLEQGVLCHELWSGLPQLRGSGPSSSLRGSTTLLPLF